MKKHNHQSESAKAPHLIFRSGKRTPGEKQNGFAANTPPGADENPLRRRFWAPVGRFAVVPLEKHRGFKMVGKGRTMLEWIFDRVDRTPMRQQQMCDKGKNR